MPTYKLHYFPLRGRAELLRYMFAVAGVEFEDIRVPFGEWPVTQKQFPFHQMPVLEVNGKQLAQGQAIARYLASEFGLCGRSKWEAAEADMYVGAVDDIFGQIVRIFFEKDATRKAEMLTKFKEERGQINLNKFDTVLSKSSSGYLVGDRLTYADLSLFGALEFMDAALGEQVGELVSKFHNVRKHHEKIKAIPNIAAWIRERPITDR